MVISERVQKIINNIGTDKITERLKFNISKSGLSKDDSDAIVEYFIHARVSSYLDGEHDCLKEMEKSWF